MVNIILISNIESAILTVFINILSSFTIFHGQYLMINNFTLYFRIKYTALVIRIIVGLLFPV